MAGRNRTRTRRPRPRIDYQFFSGNGTTPGTPAITVTLLSEPSEIGEQFHVEELQVAGVYKCTTAGVVGVSTVSMVPERTGLTSNFENAGVRNRFIMGNDQGIPFVLIYKNMNLGSGVALRFEMTPRTESGDTPHQFNVGVKIVFRELR